MNTSSRRTITRRATQLCLTLCWLVITLFATSSHASEACDSKKGTCFGIHWRTATPQDVQDIAVGKKDRDGITPLHVAAIYNENPEVIVVLMRQSAEVNARDTFDSTPLHGAAGDNKNPAVVATLLDAGADTTIKNKKGETTLDIAKRNEALKNSDAYKQLVQKTKQAQ